MSTSLAKRSLQPPFDPEDFISPVLKTIPPSGIRRFFDLVSGTKGVISLGVGEPDFVTPWHIREACVYSLEKGYTMYTSNWGLLELRQEISRYIDKKYSLRYSPQDEILITIGASEALDLALRTVLCPGDEVLIPDPAYVSYQPCTLMAGGKPVIIPTTSANEFKLTPEQVSRAITSRTKVLMLCYPNNPTGATMDRNELAALAQIAERHNLLVISDEIYGELSYDGGHTCFASLPGMRDRTVVISGFSKAFAMTGWRVGFALGHQAIIAMMMRIHQYTILCAPVMGQMAAIEALRKGSSETEKMVNQYNQRRRLVLTRLRDMGLDCFEPKGAFYIFPSIASTDLTSEEFAEGLLKEELVAVVPGNAFGPGGAGHIRISYAASVANLGEAMNRMERFVQRCRK